VLKLLVIDHVQLTAAGRARIWAAPRVMTSQLPRLYARLPRYAEFIVGDLSSYYLSPAHPGPPHPPQLP
jgi:hypothetical protein